MLPFKTILHPTDFSEHSDYAFRMACMLARDHGGRVIVLHVAVQPPVVAFDGAMIPDPVLDEEALTSRLRAIGPAGLDVPVEHRLVVSNDPVGEIVRVAQENDCDLVVMGSHGRRGLTRALLGSVAENVLRRSASPVMIVKQPFAAMSEAVPVEPCAACATLPVSSR